MANQKLRTLIVACGVAVVLLAAPCQSKACPLLDCVFGGGSQTTYMPVCPTPGCPPAIAPSPCASCPTQTYRYVPQTTYRPVFRSVPVTSYLPAVGRDPCTGCRVTTYRPVTTWTRQTTLIPYTTYRMIYTNPCNPCGATVLYGGTVIGSSCSGCSVGTASSPSVSYSYGGPTAATGGDASTKTFQETEKPPVEDEEELEPIPNGTEEDPDPGTGPDLGKPVSRTASLPVVRATYYRPVAAAARPATPQPQKMIGVWRASKD